MKNSQTDHDYFKSRIDKYAHQLKWPITPLPQPASDTPSIYSCSINEFHSLNWPEVPPPLQHLEGYYFFHEVIHAYLAETKHVLFSALDYDMALPTEIQDDIISALRPANDYFVEHFQFLEFPELFRDEQDEMIAIFHKKGLGNQRGSIDEMYQFGMLAAQAERYFERKVEAHVEVEFIKKIFAKYDPAEATIDNLVNLTKELYWVFNDYKLELKKFPDGKDRWSIAA